MLRRAARWPLTGTVLILSKRTRLLLPRGSAAPEGGEKEQQVGKERKEEEEQQAVRRKSAAAKVSHREQTEAGEAVTRTMTSSAVWKKIKERKLLEMLLMLLTVLMRPYNQRVCYCRTHT